MPRWGAGAVRASRAPGGPAPAPALQARWYGGAIVRGRRRLVDVIPRRARGALTRAPILVALAPALMSGCGSSAQTSAEPSATFTMSLVGASFPALQTIARPARMQIAVRNNSTRTMPNVAVSVDSFNYASNYPELADVNRPVWAIEQGPGARANPPVQSQEASQPGGGRTAYVNTWALGPLAPGGTRTFTWLVMPLKPGLHAVHFLFSAGLGGKAHARTAAGAPVAGRFLVHITPAPPPAYVNPRTGRVQQGPAPIIP